MLTSSDVMPKLTNGNVTPVSGSTARLPATVTASWHERQHDPGDRDPAEQRLAVVAELAAGADQARLAARDAAVMADQAMQPERARRASAPRRPAAPNTPTSAVKV